MVSIKRALRATLAIVFLWPVIGYAVPILIPPTFSNFGVSGWTNSIGNFVVESNPYFAGHSLASYSTASSLFSLRSDGVAFVSDTTHWTIVPGDTRIDVIVQETGTISGNLLGGILTVQIGAGGVPSAGIAPNEVLAVGYAIDAAAVDQPHSVLILFALTYTHPAVSSLGDYLTFAGPYIEHSMAPIC